MILDARIEGFASRTTRMLEFLRQRKQEDPSFTIVDVGGSAGGWSHEIVDVIVDIVPNDSPPTITCNLNKFEDWQAVHDYVNEHGTFSYAICSHTLEDIANPMLVLEKLPQIADEGFIAFPSKYRELSNCEGPYLGYFHHRWIYDIKQSTLLAYPKLGFLQHYPQFRAIGNSRDELAELNFQWKGGIPYRVVNNDYLGPGLSSVLNYYEALR